jgi:hypothetical protein
VDDNQVAAVHLNRTRVEGRTEPRQRCGCVHSTHQYVPMIAVTVPGVDGAEETGSGAGTL